MTQVHDIYKIINLHSLTYRKLFMQSRLSSLSKQKGMIKDDFNVTWYEVSATNTSLFDRSIVPVCLFNSLQSQMSSIFFKRMRSCRNPEKLDSRTGAIFTVHDATSRHFVLTRNSLVNTQFNGMEWTFWPRHAHCELRIFLWRIPWRGLYYENKVCNNLLDRALECDHLVAHST